MRCRACLENQDRTFGTRDVEGGFVVRRRHECLRCSHRWSTIEIEVAIFKAAMETIRSLIGFKRARKSHQESTSI